MRARTYFFACFLPIAAAISADAVLLSAVDESKADLARKNTSAKQAPAKQATPGEELQRTIEAAGNDRAALVRNLEAFLKKYPEAQERVQIYRALVEASLQLRDNARAADYAE